jgi:hypothetical protein
MYKNPVKNARNRLNGLKISRPKNGINKRAIKPKIPLKIARINGLIFLL